MNTFSNTFAEFYPDLLQSTTHIDKQKLRIIWMSLRSVYNDTESIEPEIQGLIVIQHTETMEDAESAVPAIYAQYIMKKTVELWATLENEYSHGGSIYRINSVKRYHNPEFVAE